MTSEASPGAAGWALSAAAVVVAVALVLAVVMGNLSRNAMSLSTSAPQAASGSSAQETPAQSILVETVVEVLEARGDVWHARVLAKTGERYARTDDMLDFTVPPATPFIMGVPADLHPGAIIHLRAGKGAPGQPLLVSRIVVLTTNVHLEAPTP